ncbi:SIS domain-containing protein [Caldilinea sp.]|jgi:uncharacterized phosphosugar-binding protein|uniref:SIS domain-containing protein n=1 Tax=Caldilinea sp. TaxID=2293560 RepID=UPI0026285A45|nr:SIS domain-containing protein [uncultured Caldilinea sp.]
MSALQYIEVLNSILKRAVETQTDLLLQVAARMADVIANDHLVYVFGAGHAGILAEELFYRAGGLAPIAPIFAPGLTLNTHPITLETALERLSGYARLLLDASGVAADDMLIVHSNSGRNTVAIEMAEEARGRGVCVVALTSRAHSLSVPSRHPRGLRLMDVADYVIDNCGEPGDAAVALPGMKQRVGATSTVVGAALLNAVVVETTRLLLARGVEPPVTLSANLENSEEHNRRIWERYRGRLHYL